MVEAGRNGGLFLLRLADSGQALITEKMCRL